MKNSFLGMRIGWTKFASIVPSVSLATALASIDARAADAPLGLSISLERVAGFDYASARPTSSDTSFSATSFGIAGPAINPIALPRAGADVMLPMGLTVGGALGFGGASLALNPDNGDNQTISGAAWLVSPRVGYVFHLAPILDLWPRVGVTLAGANLQEPGGQTCVSTNGGPGSAGSLTQSCSNTSGPSDSVFFVAASLDVAAVLRLTKSFNVLAGVAYDQVFAASGSTSSNSTSTDLHPEGKYLGGQLWFGLGGYVL